MSLKQLKIDTDKVYLDHGPIGENPHLTPYLAFEERCTPIECAKQMPQSRLLKVLAYHEDSGEWYPATWAEMDGEWFTPCMIAADHYHEKTDFTHWLPLPDAP